MNRYSKTAAIVDLAIRRVLTIHEQEDDEWRLTLDRQALTRTKLDPYEKKLVHALFPDEETETELSSLKHKFVSGLKTIRDSTLDHLVGTGYFRKRPDRVSAKWVGWTFLVLIGLFIFGLWQQPPWTYWVLSFGCIVGMFIIAAHMPRRTRRGLDALVRIKGMEEYLVTAEKERMKKLPMDHFERLLPYAIALGVHDRWAKAFAGLYDQPPEWYRSRQTGAFDTLDLNSRVNGMNRSVGANLLAGPRTATRSSKAGWSGGWSGGGGFSSGGGFSGGGFGGGGGGGW